MKFGCIRAHDREYPIRLMCRVLEVSAAGYYAWKRRAPSTRARVDAVLLDRMHKHHAQSRQTYGRLRLHAALRNEGIRISGKRVRRLMQQGGIVVRTRRRYKATTNSAHRLPVAQNLLDRRFDVRKVGRRDRFWAGDITYIATREGWLYLAVLLDLYSRRVVGWSMSHEMNAQLVVNAFHMAVGRRRPPTEIILHSDRGSQYASALFQAAIARHGFICSMSRKANCWDNAVVESFNATIKTELIHRSVWDTREQARAAVYEYIETWYNRERLHETLGYRSPAQFEDQESIRVA